MSVSEETKYVADITSTMEAPKVFRVDGEEYTLFSILHLSPRKEAKVTALFARFQRLIRDLIDAEDDTTAERVANRLRAYRAALIALMTDVPVEVAEKWKPGVQSEVFRVVQEEIGEQQDEDDLKSLVAEERSDDSPKEEDSGASALVRDAS